MLGTILIVILILALLGALPLGLPYNANWGFVPGGLIGLLLVVVIILVLLGHI
ncbi:DUF3309 family protein [Methylobacterium nodulans]|uniref:DUF3309 domain-containing protein n=1 Tax=Methylobacterium nodulans (strain LMG 21967 / CNCM I-2342 / ORS 2060) TaxID=460265 RepID=B8IAL1_METNO|nr:DUF3309 family protein [Methylobacterium nodulans]ACL61056.1 conserved hypothetical protein [Methylobacterium nodulans ORS 2060]